MKRTVSDPYKDSIVEKSNPPHTGERRSMICPYCNQEAKYGSNEEFYGRRYGKSYMCYYCLDCGSYVGTHQNTKKPLGTMANKELRDWRIKAHAFFDPLWKSGKMTRQQAYEWLKEKLGQEIHIGEADIETCKSVVGVLKVEEPTV